MRQNKLKILKDCFKTKERVSLIVSKKTDEWYIEWQRMTNSDNEWCNEWQWMTTSDNESYNEWQRMTTSDNEWQHVVRRVTKSENEWQRVRTNGNEWQQVRAVYSEWKRHRTLQRMDDCHHFYDKKRYNTTSRDGWLQLEWLNK